MLPRIAIAIATLAVFALSTAGARAADGDAAIGKKNFRQCGACHEVAAGKNKVGPPLNGIVGRRAGAADFNYSAGIREAAEKGLVWTEENLFAYLENPNEFLKNFVGKDKVANKMFNRYRGEDFRRDVIAYLKEAGR